MTDADIRRFEPNSATAELMEQILYEVKRVVVGQDRFLERVMVALLAGGHLLVEDLPGLGQTTLARALAVRVGLSILLFLCVLIGWKLGYLHPTGIPAGK